MSVFQVTTEFPGQIGVKPRIARIFCDDTFATIIADNYLVPLQKQGYQFTDGDIVAITHESVPVSKLFNVSITPGVISLSPISSQIVLPVTSGNIAVFDGIKGGLANGPVAGNKVLTSGIVTPDVGSNLITFDVTVGQAALAAGGSVTLVTSSGTKQYKIRSLQLNKGGTNFSGGGGDRLGQVTDGTNVYTLIPAATMQTLTNSRWGDTAIPFPASVAIDTSTAAGANLVFKYSGGTTDYTAGSLVISGLVERVA